MPKKLFKPGQSGNPNGRPKGAKDKKFLSLEFWFEYVHENSADLTPAQRCAIGMSCADKLLSKMTNLPQTPGDSLKNATEAMDLIKELENMPPGEIKPTP